MNIAVAKEIAEGEQRVALSPEGVERLKKKGHRILIESGAGSNARFSDQAYSDSGAEVVSNVEQVYREAEAFLRLQPPLPHPQTGKHELEMLSSGCLYIGFFYPLTNAALAQQAATAGIDVIAMDMLPRITRAQRMDALSSQTNLAGYKAAILAAENLGRIFPLMMTAAGTIAPAKVIVMGAGVAGLQAIATAKRLGATVEVSDVRPEVKEQAESLGAKFIEPPVDENLSGEGGYAREATPEYLKKQQEILSARLKEADAVITTALVPGKKAPRLITEEMVKSMKSGSVIVDMAAEQGGNCELSEAGKVVIKEGVTIIGKTNLPSLLPVNASELYSRNLCALIELIAPEGKLVLNFEDEIIKGCLIVHKGEVQQRAGT